jgi:hypothetical protein
MTNTVPVEPHSTISGTAGTDNPIAISCGTIDSSTGCAATGTLQSSTRRTTSG